ncbi:Slam-dependent surface lipoprotein [Methylophaga sp. UBA678]|uniref:Slam-dependent surface lipoprotein n=1 Tax=Methylophaga sp. UBA678 TaxID=1946901 RepID=UPI00259CF6DF|nr:Slam-dependent surface lipoprotein [Methylophaga sp. UBA678]|tara:strand:- start:58605 stop:59336 length:732 start_codon:yes stop_codon:yes gene_type:complete
MMKTVQKLSILALALGLSGMAHATESGQSYFGDITVGGTTSTSPDHPGTVGAPGVGVTAFYGGAMVSFSGLTSMVSADGNGIYTITPAMMPPSHAALGYFDFAKVSGEEVYFGEWSQNGTTNDPTRVVYYSGDDTGTTMPTTGTAAYTVKGINNYNGSNLLTGTLNANFGTGNLSGTMSRTGLSIAINASINSADASFSGDAVANSSAIGTSEGHFYGADAAALAGIAKFANRDYDTAFGGAK